MNRRGTLHRFARPAVLGGVTAVVLMLAALPAVALSTNDNFADALLAATLPYDHSQDSAGATTEALEPVPSCAATIGKTVWYRFTPAQPTNVGISTFGSKFDTVLAIYRGAALGDLTETSCNDDYEQTGSLQSRTSFLALAGETYHVQAGGYLGTSGLLRLSIAGTTGLIGDDFAQAITVTGLPFTMAVDLTEATSQAEEPYGCGAFERSIWFRFTAPSDGAIGADTFSEDLDTVLAAYSGDGLSNLEFLACNDDSAAGFQSRIGFRVTSGTTYYIQLGSYQYDGPWTTVLNVDSFEPPANDNFASATPIDLPGRASGSTLGAGTEPGEPDDCGGSSETVWYRWTATTPASVLTNTFGSDFFAQAHVYSGTMLEDLTLVTCADYNEASFVAVPGTTYYFQVGGSRPGDAGNARLRLTNGIHLGVDGILAGAAVTVGGDQHYRTAFAAAGAPFVFGAADLDHDDEEGGYVAACAGVVVGTCQAVGLPPTSG